MKALVVVPPLEDVMAGGVPDGRILRVEKRVAEWYSGIEILDISLDGGRVQATANHRFQVLQNGRLQTKTAAEIEVGDLVRVGGDAP